MGFSLQAFFNGTSEIINSDKFTTQQKYVGLADFIAQQAEYAEECNQIEDAPEFKI